VVDREKWAEATSALFEANGQIDRMVKGMEKK
jgi:hypothetical protein